MFNGNEYGEVKHALRHLDGHTLESYGLLQAAKRSGYICPFCENGTGENGTGVDFKEINNGFNGTCFRCGESFDVIDLLAKRFGLNAKLDFNEIIQRGAELFGIPIGLQMERWKDGKMKSDKANSLSNSKTFHLTNSPDFTPFITSLKGSFRKIPFSMTRGIDLNTFKACQVGYVAEWEVDYTPRIIFPTFDAQGICRDYGARLAIPFKDIQFHPLRKKVHPEKSRPPGSKKGIFNLPAALDTDKNIFIVEGEYDALTLTQLSFLGGFVAIAICGSSLSDYAAQLLSHCKPESKFIVMLDNDEAGQKGAPKVAEKIAKLGFKVTTHFLPKDFKDANDWLRYDENRLCQELTRINDLADKEFAENPNSQTFANLPQSTGSTTAQIYKDCPIDLTVPQGFFMDKGGIYNRKNFRITSTPIVITREFIDTEGGNREVELAILDARIHIWRKKIMTLKEISNNKDIVNLSSDGLVINSGTAKTISEFLTNLRGDNAKTIPECRIYAQPGWTDDTCTKFVYPSGGDDYVVRNVPLDAAKTYTTQGDLQAWRDMFNDVASENAVPRLCIGVAAAAPLLRVLNVPNIWVHLNCKSGSGKSAAVKFALSIYGDPNGIKLTFNATGTVATDSAKGYRDLPSWLEEAESARESLREAFDQLIYQFEQEKTRARANKNGDQRPTFEIRGSRFSTGEGPLTKDSSKQGGMVRIIEISDPLIFNDKFAADIHKFTAANFGFYGKKWIEYIIDNADTIKREFNQIQREYDEKYPSLIHRQRQEMAAIHTAFIHFCIMFGVDDDVLELMRDFCEHDMRRFAKMLPDNQSAMDITRALDAVREYTITNDCDFYHSEFAFRKQSECQVKPLTHQRPVFGVLFADGSVAVTPKKLGDILKDADFDNAKAIIRQFGEAGYFFGRADSKRPYQSKFACIPKDTYPEDLDFYRNKKGFYFVLKGDILNEPDEE